MKSIIAITVGVLYITATAITASNDTRSSNITDIFVKLSKLIPENVDAVELKKKIEEAFGNEIQQQDDETISLIEDEGDSSKNGTMDVKKWSFHNMWDKTIQYFSDLKIDLKEKYKKFANYLKNKFSKTDSEKGQSELWNLEQLAKDMAEEEIHHLKENGENSTTTIPDVKKSFFKDKWDKTKKFAKQTGDAVKEKMTSFGTYLKNKWNKKSPEVETNELNNVKKIAKQFLEDSENLPKDVAEEGLEFFEDLEKVLEDIKEKLNKTLNH